MLKISFSTSLTFSSNNRSSSCSFETYPLRLFIMRSPNIFPTPLISFETITYATRERSTDFILFRFKSPMGKDTCSFTAAIEWNKLPVSLKLIEADTNCKQAIKKWRANNLSYRDNAQIKSVLSFYMLKGILYLCLYLSVLPDFASPYPPEDNNGNKPAGFIV